MHAAQWPRIPFNLTAKIAPRIEQNSLFRAQKSKNFLGRGHSSLPRFLRSGEGDTSFPHPIPLSAFRARPVNLQQKSPPLDVRCSCGRGWCVLCKFLAITVFLFSLVLLRFCYSRVGSVSVQFSPKNLGFGFFDFGFFDFGSHGFINNGVIPNYTRRV